MGPAVTSLSDQVLVGLLRWHACMSRELLGRDSLLERMARFTAPASAVLAGSLSVVALFCCGCSEWMKSTVHRLAYMKKLNVAA